MPHVVIDGVAIEARRLTLTPAEVARVMRVEETEIRNMIRRGELRDVSSDGKRRLDPDEVIALVERRVRDGELGKHVFVELAALISGRL
ncbi:MAG: helix-turn-helix domain-containing protein [Solirubrobacteraceae bacterium]